MLTEQQKSVIEESDYLSKLIRGTVAINGFPIIDFESFKELEGKLNTYLIMLKNDKEAFSFKELTDFICKQKITEEEKVHLALSAAKTYLS